jgi:NAD(P)-dependent dehydrogenase (short-subunit alcohol dehydrogenase family)
MSEQVVPDFPEGVALVFGGSGGIGSAICRKLAASGADVALTYRRNRDAAEVTAADIENLGRRALAQAVDLADPAAVATVFAKAESAFGRIHSVVMAGGHDMRMAYLSQIGIDEFQEAVRTDLFGFFNVIHAALPRLRQQGGSIVALTSAALAHYSPMDLLSVAPKGGVEAIVRAVAREEGRFGIRANSVAMGVIDAGIMTRLWGDLSPEFTDKMKTGNALRRMGSAEEAAEAAVFLASARASYITGQRLVVDGGHAI